MITFDDEQLRRAWSHMSTDAIRAMGRATGKDSSRINEARKRILALRGAGEPARHIVETKRKMTRTELSEIISKAEAGSDEFDELLFKHLLGGLYWPENETCFIDRGSSRVPKPFTTNEAAAFALMDRVLGEDWTWSMHRNWRAYPETPNYNFNISHNDAATWEGDIHTSGQTRSLAICSAILLAAKK